MTTGVWNVGARCQQEDQRLVLRILRRLEPADQRSLRRSDLSGSRRSSAKYLQTSREDKSLRVNQVVEVHRYYVKVLKCYCFTSHETGDVIGSKHHVVSLLNCNRQAICWKPQVFTIVLSPLPWPVIQIADSFIYRLLNFGGSGGHTVFVQQCSLHRTYLGSYNWSVQRPAFLGHRLSYNWQYLLWHFTT